MRFLLTLFLLIPFGLNAATVFTEFYCDSGVGTNINAGSTTNAAAIYTAVNGNWDGTSVYTPTDGSTPASTVSAGMWASIYIDGATNLVQSGSGGCVMLITNVTAGVNGAITFQRAAVAGTPPSSSATGRSIKVGGAWNGPYGTIGFPFGFFATTATNAPNVFPRCNLKATSTYSVTAAMTHSLNGPISFSGMTLTAGDGGTATIDGGAAGTSYIVLTSSGNNNSYSYLTFQNNGNSGSASLVSITGTENVLFRCIFANAHANGMVTSSGTPLLIECEAKNCGLRNGGSEGGFRDSGGGGATFIRCISHNNAANGQSGFSLNNINNAINCISYSNGLHGFLFTGTTTGTMIGCNSYTNGGAGINLSASSASTVIIENCNLFRNTTYGIDSSGSALRNGMIVNCAFGSGTQTNSSGNISTAAAAGLLEIGSVIYGTGDTPWVNPVNENFSISTTATTRAMGRGLFLQSTINSPTNTVSYLDIGATQSASTNAAAASGGTTAHTFAQ